MYEKYRERKEKQQNNFGGFQKVIIFAQTISANRAEKIASENRNIRHSSHKKGILQGYPTKTTVAKRLKRYRKQSTDNLKNSISAGRTFHPDPAGRKTTEINQR
jgi:hypothetical protein